MTDWQEMKSLASGRPDLVQKWIESCDEGERSERAWAARLRARGFKAAHPNDGWVDRERNTIHFAYPQFNDGATTGSLVMLGWAPDRFTEPGVDGRYLRPVRLLEPIGSVFLVDRWRFVDLIDKELRMKERTAEEKEKHRAERELKEIEGQIHESTREGGEGDPVFLPWLRTRKVQLEVEINDLNKRIEAKKKEDGKVKNQVGPR